MHSLMPVGFVMFLSMNDFLAGCLFAVVVIKCFMIGVNLWWEYLAPQNIPRAISVLTLGNKVILLKLQWLTGRETPSYLHEFLSGNYWSQSESIDIVSSRSSLTRKNLKPEGLLASSFLCVLSLSLSVFSVSLSLSLSLLWMFWLLVAL